MITCQSKVENMVQFKWILTKRYNITQFSLFHDYNDVTMTVREVPAGKSNE